MRERDCNTCKHHEQGTKVPLRCLGCLNMSGYGPHRVNYLPRWEPKMETLELSDVSPHAVVSDYPSGVLHTPPHKVPTVKDTNPKDAVGIRKLPFSVLPWRVLAGVALAMLEGASKYGRHNYRAAGVRASVYFDAVVARHLTQWWEGEDIDSDSNLNHIDKAIAGLMVMRDSMLQGNFTDDRPPRGKGFSVADFNKRASAIMDAHADKKPHHYTIADSV